MEDVGYIFSCSSTFNVYYLNEMFGQAAMLFDINSLSYFHRQRWGNSQVTWIDPMLMFNMGCHI